jgi:hypothetical protein
LKVRVDSAPLVLSPIRSNERRVQWPLVVLLLSIGLTAIGAVDAQRAIRSQREVADRALREYANFAAWSYSQHLALALDGIGREVLGAVNPGDNLHTSPHVPGARELAQYLRWDDACGCRRTFVGPSPAAFFAVDLRKRVLSESDNLATGGSGQQLCQQVCIAVARARAPRLPSFALGSSIRFRREFVDTQA